MAGRFDELMHVFLFNLTFAKILCSFVFFYQIAMYEDIICIIGKKIERQHVYFGGKPWLFIFYKLRVYLNV